MRRRAFLPLKNRCQTTLETVQRLRQSINVLLCSTQHTAKAGIENTRRVSILLCARKHKWDLRGRDFFQIFCRAQDFEKSFRSQKYNISYIESFCSSDFRVYSTRREFWRKVSQFKVRWSDNSGGKSCVGAGYYGRMGTLVVVKTAIGEWYEE